VSDEPPFSPSAHDPRHTSSFEFCENGAKAVTWELTKRRITREFFAAHTVHELEQQSNYRLEEQGRLTEPMRYDPGMCGLESLAKANRAIPMASCDLQVSRQDIAEAVAALPARQQLNMQTRAVYAAAFWEPDRGLVLREDVGRNNALDKLAGHCCAAAGRLARVSLCCRAGFPSSSCKKLG
jgi:formate dehydrogenase accessory protein FdhD